MQSKFPKFHQNSQIKKLSASGGREASPGTPNQETHLVWTQADGVFQSAQCLAINIQQISKLSAFKMTTHFK